MPSHPLFFRPAWLPWAAQGLAGSGPVCWVLQALTIRKKPRMLIMEQGSRQGDTYPGLLPLVVFRDSWRWAQILRFSGPRPQGSVSGVTLGCSLPGLPGRKTVSRPWPQGTRWALVLGLCKFH